LSTDRAERHGLIHDRYGQHSLPGPEYNSANDANVTSEQAAFEWVGQYSVEGY
jgi:hypothetical protein